MFFGLECFYRNVALESGYFKGGRLFLKQTVPFIRGRTYTRVVAFESLMSQLSYLVFIGIAPPENICGTLELL